MIYKVLLSIKNIPAHDWSVDMAQTIVGSSCLCVQLVPATASNVDISSYNVVAWCGDPDRIPLEVDCSIPEPKEPFIDRAPPLFLREEELIKPRRYTLRFTAIINIIEVQD